jgi:DNA gyrase subunit A
MPLKEIIAAFVAFREEVITRRTIYELGKARDRAHVLVGLAIAVANIDEIIALIRRAPDPATAREQLMARDWPAMDVEPLIKLIDEPGRAIVDGKYRLSEAQAKAILELRLHRLTGLERDKIGDELTEIGGQIREFLEILSSRPKLLEVLRGELLEIRNQFATPRRTTIEDAEFEADIEDLIAREDMVVTVTNTGYIKRVPLSTYRAQKRGGKGRSGMSMKEEDFISQVFVANTHTPMLFFSSIGKAYKLKVYRLPLGTPQAKGKAMVNILPLEENETISTVMPMPEDETTWADLNVMFATSVGDVRRNQLSDFVDIRANGKIAMKLGEGERLIAVQTCSENDDVLLATRGGKAIRFQVGDVRVFKGRDSTGVRGIRMVDDEVISMSILRHVDFDMETRDAYMRGELTGPDAERMSADEEIILTVTQNGYGKRTSAYEYRITGRGGQGIANIDLTDKNGPVVASFPVNHEDEVMLVSDGGKLIRMPVDDIRICGRKTQGVMLFRTAEDERVVSVARLSDINGGADDDADGDVEGESEAGDDNA